MTPDLKGPKNNIDEATWLIHVDLAPGKARLGGSALAQCYKQLGDESPDLDDPQLLLRTFNVLQKLIEGNYLLLYLLGNFHEHYSNLIKALINVNT